MKIKSPFQLKGLKETSPFRNKMFLVIFLIAFFNYNSSNMLSLTLPKFASEMGVGAQSVGLLAGMFAMCALIMRPFSGQIVDNENKLVTMRICFSVMLVSVFGLTLADRYWMLLLFRGMNGFAWGVGSTLCMTIATNCFTSANMATGIGIYGLGQTLSQTIAPMIALPFSSKYGYNALYNLNVILMIICIALTFFLKVDPAPVRKRHYSFNIRNMVYFPSILPASLTFCNSIAMSSITAFLVIFAGTLNIKNIALYFTIQAIFVFVCRPVVGKLADTLGILKVLIICEIFGVIGLITISTARTMPVFIVAAVLMGIFSGGQQPILMSECVRNADATKRGSASNTSYIGTDLGNFLGSNTAGFLVAYLGYRKMYMAVVVPIIICTIVFVVKKRKKKELSAVDTVSVNTQED